MVNSVKADIYILGDKSVSLVSHHHETGERYELHCSIPVGGGKIQALLNGDPYDPPWDAFGFHNAAENISELARQVRKEWQRSITYNGENLHLDLQWEIHGIKPGMGLQRKSRKKTEQEPKGPQIGNLEVAIIGVIFFGIAILAGFLS
jgi:hypothetical protein